MTLFNDLWIEKAGPNILTSEWDSKKQGDQTLKIYQTVYHEDLKTLWFHKIKVAFFGEDMKIHKTMDVLVENREITEVSFTNENYKGILLNYEDWSFVMIKIDS